MKETKSTSGYVFTIGGVAVYRKSSKQTCIARSKMEYEFIDLDKAGKEVEWFRQFLEDIPIWPKLVPTICIHCDSQYAIGRAHNDMYNGKSRHIRRRHYTIRQFLSNGIISISYIKLKDNSGSAYQWFDERASKLHIEGNEIKAYDKRITLMATQPS